jgi:DNA-binding NarL/FixJ family response regulator
MKLVVVEDSLPIRKLLNALLSTVSGLRVVGEATAQEEAIALIEREKPDVVLLDLFLSPGHGLQVLRAIREKGRPCKTYVISNQRPEDYEDLCMQSGADGFFDKNQSLEPLISMLRTMAAPA